jgi:hypothetical protein
MSVGDRVNLSRRWRVGRMVLVVAVIFLGRVVSFVRVMVEVLGMLRVVALGMEIAQDLRGGVCLAYRGDGLVSGAAAGSGRWAAVGWLSVCRVAHGSVAEGGVRLGGGVGRWTRFVFLVGPG